MDKAEILECFDRDERRGMVIEGPYRIDRQHDVVRIIGPSAEYFDNCVIFSGLAPDTLERGIAAEQTVFGALDRGVEWKAYAHDGPPGLEDALQHAGFAAGSEGETLVALDLAQDLPKGAEDVLVRRIGPEVIGDYIAVQTAAFGADGTTLGESLAVRMRDFPDALSVWIAYDGDRPVASAWSNFCPNSQFVSFWGGSTLAEYRGRGIYTALVAARAAEAKARGLRWAYVEARETSRPILEKLGFVPVSTARRWRWSPSS